MMREEFQRLRSATGSELRKFGLTIGGMAVVISVWFLLRHKAWSFWIGAPGLLLVLLGAVASRSLRWIYVAWMSIAVVMGTVVSTVLLALLFFLVLTPIGFMARLAGKDFLARRLNESLPSYWISRDVSQAKDRARHEQQF